MLIVFPRGLLGAAIIFDLLSMVLDNQDLAIVAYWNVVGGIVMGLVAAVCGLLDWLAIPSGMCTKTAGLWHGGGNVVIVLLFIGSWLLRRVDPAQAVTTILVVLS